MGGAGLAAVRVWSCFCNAVLLFWPPRLVVPGLQLRFVTGYPGKVRSGRHGRPSRQFFRLRPEEDFWPRLLDEFCAPRLSRWCFSLAEVG